jgi:dephospho-CoA kinase
LRPRRTGACRARRPSSRRPKSQLTKTPGNRSKRPIHLAITGSVGAGKSATLESFARHGAATISSDAIVHELIAGDPEVRAALEERLGTTDRAEIGTLVFADREQLAWLEALLHPRVVARYLHWRDRQDAPLTVSEVPLLYETGGDTRFDKVVVVTAPKALRDARRTPFPGDRELRLLPDREKAKRADFVYVNTGSLEDLDRFVAGVVRELVAE